MTIARAIQILNVHAANAIGALAMRTEQDEQTKRMQEEYDALDMAIRLLQKQLVDQIPCEWCKGGEYKIDRYATFYAPEQASTWDKPDFYIEDYDRVYITSFDVMCCPNCGRKLTMIKEDKT